jgi:hypothetical protein
MDCTGHKLVERMPSATSDSKHRVANLQRGGIDWISFPFPSLMDKCYQPSAQHPSGAWNSAAAKHKVTPICNRKSALRLASRALPPGGGANMLPEPGAFSITYRLKLPRSRLRGNFVPRRPRTTSAIQFPISHNLMLPVIQAQSRDSALIRAFDIRFRFGNLWSYGHGSKRYGR